MLPCTQNESRTWLNRYWANVEQKLNMCSCFAFLCFKQSSMPNLVAQWCRWCQWWFPDEPRSLEGLEAECLTIVPYLVSPCVSLSLSLSGSGQASARVSRASAVCATGPLGISGPRSASWSNCSLFSQVIAKADPASGRETPGGTSGAPQVLHSSREFRTSWTHTGHHYNPSRNQGPNQIFHRHSLGTIIGLRWLDANWSGVGISLCHFTSIDCSCSSDFFCSFPYCQHIKDFWVLGSSCSVFA